MDYRGNQKDSPKARDYPSTAMNMDEMMAPENPVAAEQPHFTPEMVRRQDMTAVISGTDVAGARGSSGHRLTEN